MFWQIQYGCGYFSICFFCLFVFFCIFCFIFNLFGVVVCPQLCARQATGESQFRVIPEVVRGTLVPGRVDQQVRKPARAGRVAEMCSSGR